MMISFIKEKKNGPNLLGCVKIIKEKVIAPKPNNWVWAVVFYLDSPMDAMFASHFHTVE